MKARLLAGLALLCMLFVSCDDTTETIGSSLTDNMDHLTISTDTFKVTTKSIVADSVLSRNTLGYLGRIKDPETGAYITGDFMVQFHVLEDLTLPEKESIISLNDNNEIIADSCEIRLFYTDFYGDSLSTMKVTVHEMDKPMEEGVKYYSNFNPITNGYVRADGMKTDKVYTLANLTYSDSLRATGNYMPNIRIPLNEPYTDKNGKTYNNFGSYVINKYYENPSNFKNAYTFIHNVCPGFYIEVKDGLGAMAYISISQLFVYYRFKKDDNIYVRADVFAGTEEVLQTTNITNDKETINRLASDNTCTYLKTPAGIFTEMTLPVDDILRYHENDTLNAAKISLTRMIDNTHGEYSLDKPTTLLMVERDSMYTFFEKNDIADGSRSYLSTASGNTYTFSNISNLIRIMADAKAKGMKENSNWIEKHPNWNKVVIIPVQETYVQTSVLAKVTHDMKLSSAKLVGGSNNPYDDIKISVIYSKFAGK